jgi:hypothetical protein
MEATRVHARFGSAVDWVVAGIFLCATLGVTLLIVNELRLTGRTPPPVAPRVEPATAVGQPTSIPQGAIRVPKLFLLDGKQIQVGDLAEEVHQWLAAGQVGTEVVDRGVLGPRITRAYQHAGTNFFLVFEPFERNGVHRVAGIYLK